ncbi:hypothetical protein P8C59_009580 [Phyllachora maydis]|uniref:Reverse transcriptase Ty1/copia-type domain-containing protein n=1 Tax=Phyllachora maydis TaxID=1825666 RepID=A0AAD9MGJ2_9PEZI|nr:hypothetical protein P8C59_009580 [Phyllachora maydis]
MADQAKGKGIAPKRASNPADPGQSSRPLPPIQTLLEDEEDGEDYSQVIEVLKQYIKSYKRVIGSQSSDIKTLLLSLNTLKASVEDSVSAIKNISSTLASLTNSSNAAATRKTSYSPRFDPFSGTMDLDSPLCPPRKEPHLGPAVNSATSNLDPPIDIGSKEGFKDTITSSIVKELSKKAYTIPDDKISNFLENPDISNTYSDSDQAVLLMLLRDSLSSSPRAALSRPIESKKEDVYNEFHALTFSTYRKGLSAFNAEFNSYLAKLTMAKIDIDPSLILNQYFKALESKFPSWAYRAAHIANSSNSTPNSNPNPSKKGKNKKKGKKKASYNVKGQNYTTKSAEKPSFILGSYNLAIEEEEEFDSSSNSRYKKHKDFKGKGLKTSSNNKAKYKDNQPRRRPRDPALYNSWLYDTGSTDHISNSKERFTTFTPNTGQLRPINTGNGPVSPAGIGSITLEVLSRKAPPTYTKLVLDNVYYLPNIDINIRNKIVVEIPSNSIRKEDYRPIIEDTIVSEAIEPNKRYKLRNSPAKGTTLEGIGPSLRGKRPRRPIEPLATAQAPYQSPCETREPEPLTGTGDLPHVLRELVIEGNKVEKAISSPTLKEPNTEDNIVLSQPTDNTALEGELVDLDLDLEGAVSPDPSNLNTEKLISIEIGPSKLEPYESSSDSELDEPSPDKPINPVIVESTRPTISIRKPKLPEAFPQTIEPILVSKPIELDYYKLLAKTSSYILSFVYKARKRVISKDSTPNTYKQVLKLPRDERSKWLEAITKEFIPLLELGVFKFLPRSLLPSNLARGFMQVKGLDYTVTYASTSIPSTWRILLAIGAVLDEKIEQADFIGVFLNSALREEIYMEIPEGLLDLAASNKAIYKLLLKYSYNPSTPNIIKLSKALYRVFYNAKTCHFIVTYIDDCLFIGPDIGYITDLKKRLNKVYAIEDLGPAAYFLGYVEEAVSRFNLADSKPISIPLQPGLVNQLQLEEDITSHLYNSTEIKLYQSLVGTAIYIMLLTRVDISFTVQWLSRSLNRPTKSHLNATKNLSKYLNSTKDYSICFSCNGNTVADLGPKLSNSSNTTTKLSRDFHSKEGPRPLTTTSTTIVDSRNSKGSSRTSIINSSQVPIGFSDSDFTGDKATSKSTYGYLYKLAGRPISWKTKRATTIALSTLEAETDGLTEAIREVQWIIGLFSELYRPIDYPITLYGDNQGSITVANDLALHARTKHTLLKFRYVREQVKAKIVTIIYLNTKFNSTGYFTAL